MNEHLPKALVIGSGFGGIGAALRFLAGVLKSLKKTDFVMMPGQL